MVPAYSLWYYQYFLIELNFYVITFQIQILLQKVYMSKGLHLNVIRSEVLDKVMFFYLMN